MNNEHGVFLLRYVHISKGLSRCAWNLTRRPNKTKTCVNEERKSFHAHRNIDVLFFSMARAMKAVAAMPVSLLLPSLREQKAKSLSHRVEAPSITQTPGICRWKPNRITCSSPEAAMAQALSTEDCVNLRERKRAVAVFCKCGSMASSCLPAFDPPCHLYLPARPFGC